MKIVVADDHPLMRAGIRATLSSAEEVSIVGEAKDHREVRSLLTTFRPDLLILDAEMPGGNAEEFVHKAKQLVPQLKILLLTREKASAPRIDHISGHLLKDQTPEQLLQAVRLLAQGGKGPQ